MSTVNETKCRRCDGTGLIYNSTPVRSTCPECLGTGGKATHAAESAKEDPIPDGAARSKNGTTYYAVAEAYHCFEEGEAAHKNMDAAGVPRTDDGKALSLWGRICRFAATTPPATPSTASPVQGAASASGAKGAAVKPWGERWKTHHSTVDEAKDAEIADWRALAERAQSQHPTEKLLRIIAYAYQIAGAHNVPEHILDVLCDPEEATNAQVEAMLPYQPAAQPSGAVMTAFKELVGKNTRRRPRIVGNDVEYRNEIDTYQIGRDAIDIAYGKANTATPVPKQEAAQVSPSGAQEIYFFRMKGINALWTEISANHMAAVKRGPGADAFEYRTLYTAPVAQEAEQP